ncbi:MAG TPA: hypothetical protein VK750_02050, partial [Cytophagaceae bacterium]|nr:hypothetical protein [Cytophagaceae bacterium]
MKTVFKRRFLKSIALFFAFNILFEVIFPSVAWALTDGPKQPEYSGFEPVATTNMVSDFTGAFSYNLPVVNIPGPNGSGYAMSLSYHSGATSESEASWVGHGWSLNPGAINRNLQGIPDDYNGDSVTYFNKRKPNITATIGPQVGAEAYSIDVNANFTYSYNNYRGFGTKFGLGLGIGYGLVSLGYTVSGQEPGSFTAEANPGALLKVVTAAIAKKNQKNNTKTGDKKTSEESQKTEEENKKPTKAEKLLNSKAAKKLEGIKIGINSNAFNMTTALDHYSDACFSMNFTTTFGLDPTLLHIGVEFGYDGSLSFLQNEESFVEQKSGLLYSSKNDYSVEKENPYNLRDRYLPIPHKAKDQFMITGEMMNGGFSLVDPNLGQAEITTQANSVKILNAGMDTNVGLNMGVGANTGVGISNSQVTSFDYSFPTSSNVAPYFRFNNDMGGEVVYSQTNVHSFTSGLTPPNIDLNSADYSIMNVNALPNRAGSAGFIGYTTMGDRTQANIFSATKDSETLSLVTASVPSSRITDIYTVNDKGSKLIYGLPVFVTNETQISEDVLERGYKQSNVDDIFIKTDGNIETQLGHQNTGVYATSYLLTQINTPDYIDRKLDGPTCDDFGGWTKFGYRNPAYVASSDKNFRYRMPYVGLSYQQNTLTDKDDDLGSYQSGTKEMYYLKQVETKTHIAFFITNKTNFTYQGLTLQGSGIDRHDGVEAADDESARAGNTGTAQKRPEYLEKIIVYSKNNLTGKPLSTVNFQYSYEVSPGVLNHFCTDTDGKGKLTLKKVWFEYEGVIGAKIAPYEFTYAYKLPTEYTDTDLKTKYADVINYGSSYTATDQNPTYQTWAIDPWGTYRNDGINKILAKECGINQVTDPHLDPAAWQLKQIKLPTGGEILIQYEQHDYRYVQDQPALTMIPLSASSSDFAYTINDTLLQDLKVPGDTIATTANKTTYVAQLNSYLSKEKIYFKFLYSLFTPTDPGSISLENCTNEYIDGFCNASALLNPNGKISIQLENDGSGNSPKDVCKWFVKRMVAGKTIDSHCDKKNIDLFFPQNSMNGNLADILNVSLDIMSAAAHLEEDDLNAYSNAACPSMSLTHSYLRVPVFKVKKGGGARVKRILMYDQGIEAASGTKDRDEVLYGTEYIYQGEDGLSSGVATNEPTAMHEENALVRSIVQRNDPTWKQKMMSGVDRECFEGPLGEQLLPSASIGYSRIITQNIHSGKSNTGYKITEYATCNDFPFKAKNSSVRSPEPDKYNIPAIIVSVDVDRRAAAQSYEFLMNDMHGKLKSVKMYKGSYDLSTHQDDKYTFSEIHEYYGLEDKVNVMDRSGTITPDYIGKEETVTFESRHAQDEYIGMCMQFDASVGFDFPPPVILPQFSGMGYIGYSLKEFRSAVFNKAISITAIEKSVTTTSDGITHVQEFKVFNKYTGEPVVIDTYDGYDGLVNLQQAPGTYNGRIRSHKIPAHYAFEGMGQKVQNEQLTFSGKTFSFSLNKL